MSFLTSLSLSFNNLRTKKGRTILTSFAGSIGIIGIALILSLSNGVNTHISSVEEETLSEYPLQIQSSGVDISSLLMEPNTTDGNNEENGDINVSDLKPLTNPKETNVFIANVTFEPGCRNNWHIHHAKSGGGQILICVDGEGWYQEEGKTAQSLKPGDVVTIPANVKHWHGAKKNSWFSHLAVEVPGEETQNEWCEKVTDEEYNNLD